MNASNHSVQPKIMSGPSTSLLIITVVFVCISIIGTIGNGLVILVVKRLQRHGKKSNVHTFLLHLALSDLFVCIVCIPLTILMNFLSIDSESLASVIACKTSRFFQFLTPTISSMILTAISIDRYYAMVKPLHKFKSFVRNPKLMVCVAWTISLVLFIPTFFLSKIENIVIKNLTIGYCTPIPYNTEIGYGFLIVVGIISFVLPVITLSCMYGMIVRVVWFRHRELNNSNTSKNSEQIFRKSKKKVLQMLMIVVVAYLCCWLPFVIYCGFIEMNVAPFPNPGDVIRISTYSLGLFNSILNPFIYFFSNSVLRRACIDLVCCRKFQMPNGGPVIPSPVVGKRFSSTKITNFSPNLNSSKLTPERRSRGQMFHELFHQFSAEASPSERKRGLSIPIQVIRPDSLPVIPNMKDSPILSASCRNGLKCRSDNMLGIPKKQMPTRTTLEGHEIVTRL